MQYPGFHIDLLHPTTGKPVRVVAWFEGLTEDDLRKYFDAKDLSLMANAMAVPLQYAHLPRELRQSPFFFQSVGEPRKRILTGGSP